MKIRRNQDGHMLYIDARELVDVAVKNGILHQLVIDGVLSIVVYISGGKLPDGFYPIPKGTAIQHLMRDDEGINAVYNALKEKGVDFEPSFKGGAFL